MNTLFFYLNVLLDITPGHKMKVGVKVYWMRNGTPFISFAGDFYVVY
jgi:hypothetical protein